MAKPCPQCVIEVGGTSVLLRHRLAKAVKAFDCDETVNLIDQVRAKLEASKPEMKKHGMKQMEYGMAYQILSEIEAIVCQIKGLEGRAMVMHDHLASKMDKIGVDTPTDEQLVGIVGTLNFR